MDGGAWKATVHGNAKSRTRLSNFTSLQVGHNFSSKEQACFNFMAAVNICSDFGAPQNNNNMNNFMKRWQNISPADFREATVRTWTVVMSTGQLRSQTQAVIFQLLRKKTPTRSARCVRKTGLQVPVRGQLQLLPALIAPFTTHFPGAQPLPSFHMKTLLAERALRHSLLWTPPLVRGSPRGRGVYPNSRAAGGQAGSLVSEAQVGEESHTSKSRPSRAGDGCPEKRMRVSR